MTDRPARVLTVCTGNICRSPAMELYLARAWGDDADVSSAGTFGSENVTLHNFIPSQMAAVIADHGLDPDPHRPRQLTADLIDESDLVLVATRRHAAWVQELMGDDGSRTTFLLTEAAELAGRGLVLEQATRAGRIRAAAAILDGERQRQRAAEAIDVEDPWALSDAAHVASMRQITEASDTLIAWIG